MTSSRPVMTRRRLTALGGAVASLAMLVPLASAPAGAASPSGAGGSSARPAPQARTADVMTRNLYLGADLFPVIGALATNPGQVPAAASLTWGRVQATRPAERMAALAEEIAEARPAVVGLQEVTRWTTYDSYPATDEGTVRYDFLRMLLDELSAEGAQYRVVKGATAVNFGSPPIPLLPGSGAAAVSMSDRDVILRRVGVKAWNAQNGTFTSIIRFPLADGTVLPVSRGWGSVDVRTKRATFRFVNSHLEAFGVPGVDAEQLRFLQVGELLAAQEAIAADAGDLPMVYVGDYNSQAPGGIAYRRLVAAVGGDAWVLANPGEPGLTCCFDDAVSDPDDPLTSRIDLVLVGPEVTVTHAVVVGEELEDRTPSGLWPSDHAGVLARLVIG